MLIRFPHYLERSINIVIVWHCICDGVNQTKCINTFLWSSPAGILRNDQRGVCTDDGELLLLCNPRHQKPPHLHAVLDSQGAQDRQLPQPSGKCLQSDTHLRFGVHA